MKKHSESRYSVTTISLLNYNFTKVLKKISSQKVITSQKAKSKIQKLKEIPTEALVLIKVLKVKKRKVKQSLQKLKMKIILTLTATHVKINSAKKF